MTLLRFHFELSSVTDTFDALVSFFSKAQEIPTHLADTQAGAARSADEKEAWKEDRWDVYAS